MVKLQMRPQASKYLDQSGSKNAATIYHRLSNDTKENDQDYDCIAQRDLGSAAHSPGEQKKKDPRQPIAT
jgi:hypothetical protein